MISFLSTRLLCAVTLTGLLAGSAQAVIISGGSGSAPLNNTAPANDPGWDRVGSFGNGTGVYLGNGWVLTAAHVNVSTFDVNGTSYTTTGATQNIANPTLPGLNTTHTDLRLHQINLSAGDPLASLGALNLASSPVTTNTAGVMIGTGVTQTSQTASHFAGGDSGFFWDTSRDKQWANIGVDQIGEISTLNGTDVVGFLSPFDNIAGSGSASNHDSGAPLFVLDNGQWVLAGLAHAVGPLSTTGGNNTLALHDQTNTFFSDLSFYASAINSIVVIPEPSAALLILLGLPALMGRRRR